MARLLCFVSFLFILSCGLNPANESKKLSPDEFDAMLQKNPGVQLLDVRTPKEFQSGYIAGAKNLNIHDPEFAGQIETLDKTKPVLVYCAKGGRSATAAEQLKRAGFSEVYDLPGGMEAWRASGKTTAQ